MANVTINTTSNSAAVHIYNMNTDHYTKQIVFYLNESYYDSVGLDNGYDCPDGTYDFTYRNLSPNTNYTFSIEISMLLFPSGADPYYPQASLSGDFTTDPDGGGGGDSPTYTVEVSGSSVIIKLKNAGSNCQFQSYLCNEPQCSTYNYSQTTDYNQIQDTYSDVANGIYYVEVYYRDNNTGWKHINNDDTETWPTEITVNGSGPSPSGDWYYAPLSAYVSDPSSIATSYTFNQGKTGYSFVFTFDQPGELWVGSFQTSGSLISYWDTENTGYDSATGQPYSVTDSSTGSFGYTYIGTQNQTFYLWVNSASNGYSYTLNVEFTPTQTYPTYTASVINTNQIYFSVSNIGNYYLRYFVKLTNSPQTTIYDTWEQYGALVSNTTLTVPNLLYNTSYTVNVGYSTISSSGEVNLIGAQALETGSQPISSDGYVYIYTGSRWQKAIPYIYTGSGANQGWKQATPYIFNGTEWKKCIE